MARCSIARRVGAGEVGPLAEVLDVAVGAVRCAGRDDAFDGGGADVLDDAEAEADGERAVWLQLRR